MHNKWSVFSMKKYFVGIIAILCVFCSTTLYASNFFSDIWGHWAEDDIMWGANDVPLFAGYDDGTFKPEDKITNAEFMAILYRAADMKHMTKTTSSYRNVKKASHTYKDLNRQHWAYDEMKNIIALSRSNSKWIDFESIYPGDYIKPNANITREQVILLTSYLVGNPISTSTPKFSDLPVSHPHYETIKRVVQNGIISGSNGKILLEKPITRAEAAAIIRRVYKEMDLLGQKRLKTLKYNESIYDEKYVYFGDYLSRNSQLKTEMDLEYAKAVNTLEYLTIIKTIPYKEREFYDANPLGTLKKLKDKKYWNTVGVNYYLLKYNIITNEKLVNEALENIVKVSENRTDLNNLEYKMLVELYIGKYKKQNDKALKLLNAWDRKAKTEEEKIDIIFFKTSIYDLEKRYDKALALYNQLPAANVKDLKLRMNYINNRGYVLLKMNRVTECRLFLNNEYTRIKNSSAYGANRKYYDDSFKAMLKTAYN